MSNYAKAEVENVLKFGIQSSAENKVTPVGGLHSEALSRRGYFYRFLKYSLGEQPYSL